MSTDTQDSAPAGVKPVAWMDKLISLVVAYGDSRHFEVEAVDKRDAVCRTTQAFADLMEHVRRAPVAAQPGLTQQTLDDVMAGIPARDAEIAALQAQQDADKVDVALAEMVHAMFRSGNSVPVTRIMIDRKQYESAIDAARKEQA